MVNEFNNFFDSLSDVVDLTDRFYLARLKRKVRDAEIAEARLDFAWRRVRQELEARNEEGSRRS